MLKKILFVLLFVFILGNVHAELTDDINAYYNFDEASGDLLDQVTDGTNNDGTNTDTTYQEIGIIEYAYGYNGSSSRTSLADESTFDTLTSTTSTFTINSWINLTTLDGTILGKRTDVTCQAGFQVNSSGNIRFVQAQSSNFTSPRGDSVLSTGEWYMVTLVSNAGTISMYVNGEEETITVDTGGSGFSTCNNNANAELGRTGTGTYFGGDLDEFGYWTKVLSQAEVIELYNNAQATSYPFIRITSDFNYEIDSDLVTLNLYDQSTQNDVIINDWNWLVNSSTTGLNNPDAQNPTFSSISPASDYNVSLCVGGLGTDGNIYTNCLNELISFDSNGQFNFYDENSLAELTGVSYTISPSINGLSSGTLTDNNLDLNFVGITNTTYLFTFSKTGYGTRYYQTNLTEFSDIDVNFALNPSSLSENIPFKIYQTDETTIFANTFVELYRPDKNNLITGKRKTNASGETTFNIATTDQNYYANVNEGEFEYQPVALTILYPKNELTLNQITEDWKIDITQNLYESFTDLNTDKVIYLLPNTALPFNIRIQDMNGNYFARTFAKQYPGNPLVDTLQPYLVPIDTGLLTTINTLNANTTQTLPGITIKIYKFISGSGRTLVEEVITDAKGQALVLLELNSEYEFETYQDAELIETFEITATSNEIFIYLDVSTGTLPTQPYGFNVDFTPTTLGLKKINVGNQVFTQTTTNFGEESTNYVSQIIQNGIILSTQTVTNATKTQTFSHTIDWEDLNIGTVTSRVTITIDGNTSYISQTYQITDVFTVDLYETASVGLRNDFACDTSDLNVVCFPLLALAILISIGLALYASAITGSFSGQATGIIFAVPMIIFAMLAWVPWALIVGIIIILASFIIMERR